MRSFQVCSLYGPDAHFPGTGAPAQRANGRTHGTASGQGSGAKEKAGQSEVTHGTASLRRAQRARWQNPGPAAPRPREQAKKERSPPSLRGHPPCGPRPHPP